MGKFPSSIIGRLVKRFLEVRAFENSLTSRAVDLLKKAESEVLAQIQVLDPGTAVTFKQKQKRLKRLLNGIRRTINNQYSEIQTLTKRELKELARIESEFAGRSLHHAVGTASGIAISTGSKILSAEMIKQIVEIEPLYGTALEESFTNMSRKTQWEFKTRLQIGMAQGESTDQLIRRIRGRKENGFKDGIMQGASTRSIGTFVTTAVNQVSNRAYFSTYSANNDITEKYEYVATLDDRTSLICMALDGKVYSYKDPKRRMPPQHPRCRSVIVPVIKWNELGLKPPSEGNRAAKGGPVRSSVDYPAWLVQQPAAVQDQILGPARGALFRSGKARIRDFVRDNGKVLSLPELARRVG